MAEIVNLRQARKRRSRAEKDAAAEANRLAHGRPKAERAKAAMKHAIEAKRLDAHRRTPDETEG